MNISYALLDEAVASSGPRAMAALGSADAYVASAALSTLEQLAAVSGYVERPLVSLLSNDLTGYDWLTSVAVSQSDEMKSLLAVMAAYGWTKCVFLSKWDEEGQAAARAFSGLAALRNVTAGITFYQEETDMVAASLGLRGAERWRRTERCVDCVTRVCQFALACGPSVALGEILRLSATNSAAVANQPVSSKLGLREQFDRVLNRPAKLARGRVGRTVGQSSKIM